jgi:hypothetical protein
MDASCLEPQGGLSLKYPVRSWIVSSMWFLYNHKLADASSRGPLTRLAAPSEEARLGREVPGTEGKNIRNPAEKVTL